MLLGACLGVAGQTACAKPLARGDGPATLTLEPPAMATRLGRLVGHARFELIDYEDTCPRFLGRSTLSFRKAVVKMDEDDDDPVRIVLVPGHRYKLSLDHFGAGDGSQQKCGAEVWFNAADGDHYVLQLSSDLETCSVSQPGPDRTPLVIHASCEAARRAAAPAKAP